MLKTTYLPTNILVFHLHIFQIKLKTKKLTVLIVVFVLVGATFAVALFQSPKTGKATPFKLKNLDGIEVSLEDFHGKVVVLDFMATWCKPCITQIPHLSKIHDKYGDKVVILSISVDPNTDTVERLKLFASTFNITWTILRDTAKTSSKYDVTAIPTIFVIDKEGYIKFKHVGVTEESTLSKEIDSLLK